MDTQVYIRIKFWYANTHPYHIMMTSSNGNIFRVTSPLCGEFTGPGEFPTQRPVTRNFDVFFDLRLNKRLSKQPWGWWFETLSWSLWRQRNVPFNWSADITLRRIQNCHCFADDIFKCIVLNENVWISLKISLKFVPNVRINNTSSLVQIMAWRRPGDKPLSEPMVISLLAHICINQLQWVISAVKAWMMDYFYLKL